MPQKNLVLFVCLHGSAKSVVAMEYFNRFAAERELALRAISAGTEPDEVMPPEIITGLAADGFDLDGRLPLRLTPELLAEVTEIISFGPPLETLAPATTPLRYWSDMPAVTDDYGIARDAIRRNVLALVEERSAA
jgi:protein-tyrosine-phosphatase